MGGLARTVAVLILPAVALGAAELPVVKMAPVQVAEAMLDIKVVIRWQQGNYAAQWVDSIRVGDVKSPSIAKRAGLVPGMEIIAIQGQFVHGLSRPELTQMLQQEVAKEVVLLVRRSDRAKQEEIRVPVVPLP